MPVLERMLRTLLIWLVVVVTATVVNAQTVFMSRVGTVESGVAVGNPNLPFSTASVVGAELNIWAILETDQTLEAHSLNLVATTPGVIELKSVDVKNPFLESAPPLEVFRWEYINEPAGTPGEIAGFAAFQVGNFADPDIESKFTVGAGIGPTSAPLDALYDAGAKAWLLATVAYDVVGYGSTELFLQIGANGFLASDAFSADIDVVFGGGDPALNAESQRGENSLTADARVFNVELLGDVNADRAVNGLDIDPFVAVLLAGVYDPAADMNLDGATNGLDVDPFVDRILGGTAVVVPEPSTVGLVVAAVLAFGSHSFRKTGRFQE